MIKFVEYTEHSSVIHIDRNTPIFQRTLIWGTPSSSYRGTGYLKLQVQLPGKMIISLDTNGILGCHRLAFKTSNRLAKLFLGKENIRWARKQDAYTRLRRPSLSVLK